MSIKILPVANKQTKTQERWRFTFLARQIIHTHATPTRRKPQKRGTKSTCRDAEIATQKVPAPYPTTTQLPLLPNDNNVFRKMITFGQKYNIYIKLDNNPVCIRADSSKTRAGEAELTFSHAKTQTATDTNVPETHKQT
jgi:hypothetical protein